MNLSSDSIEVLAKEVYRLYKKDIEDIGKNASVNIKVDAKSTGQKYLNEHTEDFTKQILKGAFESLDMENLVKEEIGSNIDDLRGDIKKCDTEVTEVKRHVTGLTHAFERMQEEKKRSESIFKGFNDKLEIFLRPLLIVFVVGLLFCLLLSVTNTTLALSEWYYPIANEVFNSDGIFKSVLGFVMYLLPAGLFVAGISR